MAIARAASSASLCRREYKYLVDERTAERIRRYIEGTCTLDRYAQTDAGRYLCDTLYFDTLRLHTYRATVEGAPTRHKVRIRAYPGAPTAPVFLEVKRRVDDVIVKSRAPVIGDWARFLDDGTLVDRVAMRDRTAAENFLAYYHGIAAGPLVPTVLVRYEREPYFSLVDDYARVTFDRKLCYQQHASLSLTPEHEDWTPIDHAPAMRFTSSSAAVLELKFGEVAPSWMQRMVQVLDLRRDSFCKYTRAIDSMLDAPSDRAPRIGLLRSFV
jgi:hypothetical protein